MASRFWTWISNIAAGQTARAEQVNNQLEGIDGGFAGVADELNRSIRFTDGTPAEGTYQLSQTPVQRANLLLGFDANGALTMRSGVFVYRGDWAAGVLYNINDVVRAPEAQSYSLHVATAQHISTASFADDLASSLWAVMVDLTQTERAIKKFQLVSASRTLQPGDDVFVDVSGGPVTLTLPASPLLSDQPIHVCHFAGNIQSNPITIARNGQRIMGLSENMTVNTTNAAFELAFSNSTGGWRLIKGT